MVRTDKTEYRLFQEDAESGQAHFVLSAARTTEGSFLISHYEDFPSIPPQDRNPKQYCAMLIPVKLGEYRLYSCSCEGCDRVLGKYTCGNCRLDAPAECRQLLGIISHEKKKIDKTASEAHWMRVTVPGVQQKESPDTTFNSRHVWCVRNETIDQQGQVRKIPNAEKLVLESALPVWNKARGSLSMKFAEGRVKKASAKNFSLLACHQDGARAVLQFGKYKKRTFAMDIREPMSLIQGFGISLSVADWKP
eukprot:TRINITY_DN3534_c0_g1_i1.p1 TRINITY_DN3534_c0_g1~~TRINITY_DN3534_c0_g1_i1.p1  ORF type:complete len:250 (-),score=43.84 TRINITY_DN3534_c0_g1_i1:349-1098(-)